MDRTQRLADARSTQCALTSYGCLAVGSSTPFMLRASRYRLRVGERLNISLGPAQGTPPAIGCGLCVFARKDRWNVASIRLFYAPLAQFYAKAIFIMDRLSPYGLKPVHDFPLPSNSQLIRLLEPI